MQKKKQTFNRKAFLKIIIPFAVVMLFVAAGVGYLLYMKQASQQNISPTTLAMLQGSIRSMIHLAPVDARTGDTYFPAMKLYIPANVERYGVDDFTYGIAEYDSEKGDPLAISVGRAAIGETAAMGLVNAFSDTELFAMMAHANACAKGMTLTLSPLKNLEGRKLHHKQLLNDGRSLYVYYNPDCADLREFGFELERMRSY